MCLFLLWCGAVVGRSGGPNIVGGNSRSSRFGRFTSRLGRCEFPVRVATGIRRQRIDLPSVFLGETAVAGPKSAKFPSEREKPGILLPAERPWLSVRRCNCFTTAVGNRAEPVDVARAGDPGVVELADAGLAGLAEPLGERSVSGASAYRRCGLFDVGLGPDLAARSGGSPPPLPAPARNRRGAPSPASRNQPCRSKRS